MPKKTDHTKARAELAKLPSEALQAITVRLPAIMLIGVHKWAEQRGLDLASAIRELTSLGQEAASRPGGPASTADRNALKKWGKRVEQALRAGRSPIDPFLAEDNPTLGLEALPVILAGLDYQTIFQAVKMKQDQDGPLVEQIWMRLKIEAPTHLQPLMEGLDMLEKKFLARKKLYYRDGPEGECPILNWVLSDAVMTQINEPLSDNTDVEAARKLIEARYLVAESPARPWEFLWDE